MKWYVSLGIIILLLPVAYAIDVSDCTDLQNINSGLSGDYILTNDIDCTGVTWTPLGGRWSNQFQGTLDGNGYIISNLNINRPSSSWVGMFTAIGSNGAVVNLGLENITVTANSDAGTIAAYSEGQINNSYATGSVTISSWNALGGLVAVTGSTSSINNCYAQVDLTGNDNAGGLIGNKAGTVTNSYSAGTMTISAWPSYSGGFFGTASGTDSGNYWDTTLSGRTTSAGSATGKTTTQMKQQATFIGWDFTNTWAIEEGVIYPYLQIFGEVVEDNETSVYDAHYNYYIERMPDGTYRIVAGEGVTYFDGDEYVPVVLDFYELDTSSKYYGDYQFGMESLRYTAVFKNSSNRGQLVTFESNNVTMTFQPQNIGYVNNNDYRETISDPQDTGFINNNETFIYPDAYGTGIDLTYVGTRNYLKEAIVIENLSVLTPPSQTAIDGGNVSLFVNFILEFQNETDLIINGEVWDNSTIFTDQDIQVHNENMSTVFLIKKPYMVDANDNQVDAMYMVEENFGAYILMIRVPYDEVQNATFPITIDPTTGYNDTVVESLIINLTEDEYNPLNTMVLYNTTGDAEIGIDVNISNHINVINGTNTSYAIDPERAIFDKIDVEVKPTQDNVLFKCPSWNFTTETCPDGWISLLDVARGEYYNFTIWNATDPGFRTINFTDTANNTAYEGQDLNIPPATNVVGTPALVADYAAISDTDDTRWQTRTNTNNYHAWQRFVWNLTDYDLIDINVTWEGYGTAPSGYGGNGFRLYALNTTANAWYQIATSTTGTDATYTAQITDTDNFLNGNDEFVLLVETIGVRRNPGQRAEIYTDFVKLDLSVFCSPKLNEDWVIDYAEICDNKIVTTGTGQLIIETGGSLELKNNAQVTTTSYSIIDRWRTTWLILIERGSQLIFQR